MNMAESYTWMRERTQINSTASAEAGHAGKKSRHPVKGACVIGTFERPVK